VNIKTDEPDIRATADRLKHHPELLTAGTESDLEAAFATIAQHRVRSLIVTPYPFFFARSKQHVARAARHAMPAIYPDKSFVDLYQQAGIYVGKILNGAKPADLPIQQSTKVELVINLTTANALSLKILASTLVQTDEVIE